MPALSPASVRKQIADGNPESIYLIVGDDEAEMSQLVAAISGLVEDELRAFNLERVYANDKGVTPSSIVESARTLPMLGDRRVVVVLRAERILKPKRRGKTVETDEEAGPIGEEEPPSDLDALDDYARRPEPQSTLVLVASDIDRQRKAVKTLLKQAAVVECWGLKGAKDARVDFAQITRTADAMVKQAVAAAGQHIEPAASRLLAARAGADISRLRADLDRLLLFAAGKAVITVQDAQEVVSVETAQDDWAVTNAIGRSDARDALRQLALALDSGGVPYQVLGQLAWYVREKMAVMSPNRVPAAIEALFRTDLDLKSSGGDPRVLLERLVVELCRR